MPRHDPPETEAEADDRVERELRDLIARYGVRHLTELPRELLRGVCARLAHEGPRGYHRVLMDPLP